MGNTKWYLFFILTSLRSFTMSFNLKWSVKFQIFFFAAWIRKHRLIGFGELKKDNSFLLFELSDLKINLQGEIFLHLDFWLEVRDQFRRPPRGQKIKIYLIFEIATPKTYVLMCMMQKTIFWNFDLWSEIIGYWRWPPRGWNEKLRTFLSSSPQKHIFLSA